MRFGIAVASFIASAATPAAEPTAAALDRIVVTAQKREQAASDVPLALTLLRGDEVQRRGIRNVEDVQHAVPALEVEPAFGSRQLQFRLRGVGFLDYMTNNPSPVGIFQDGVGYAFPVQASGRAFDLERIEVLRGPQGTLYGRNTTGGAVNLVSAAPGGTFGAGVQVEQASRGAREIEAFVTGAPSDATRARLSLLRAEGGAWQHHRDTGEALGDADVLALRAQLDADLGERWQAQLDAHHARDRSDGHGLQLLSAFQPAFGGSGIPADEDPRATGWGLRPGFAARVGLAPDARPGRDDRNEGAALTVLGEFEGVSMTGVSAVNRLARREYGDYDATTYAESDQVFRSHIRTTSQELRLQSDSEAPWSWTSGVHVSSERLDEESFVDLTQRLGGELLTEYRQDSRTRGAFARVEHAFAPAWRAAFGLRHDREHRELADFVTRFLTPPVVYAGPADRALAHSGNSGELTLQWRPDAETLAYAGVRRGFKSGGFTAHNTPDAATLDPFAPETLVAWETGIKRAVSPMLQFNAALFHYDYRDQQVLSAYFEPLSQSLTGFFVNAPRSRIQGAEVNIEWRPRDDVTITQFVAWKHGRYTSRFITFDPVASLEAGANVFSDQDGNALDFPRLDHGGRIARRFPLGGGWIDASLAYHWRGRYEQRLLLGPGYAIAPYWLAHADITWQPRGARWSVGARVDNLLDESYDLTRNYFLPGTPVVARGEPRSVALRWTWHH